MSFLSTSDLCKTVAFVSRGWEEAARVHLISCPLVSLNPGNLHAYLASTNARSNHYKRIHISKFDFDNPRPEESRLLETFASTATAPITQLRIDYFPHRVETMSPEVIAILTNCHNLKFLHLSPRILSVKEAGTSVPQIMKFLSVKNLEISMYYNSHIGIGPAIEETIFEVVKLFPNLGKLKGDNLPKNVVEYLLSKKASVESIVWQFDDPDLPVPILIVNHPWYRFS
ncbi:hypothetical protein Fcan01_15870 [Folsomia candida]|uniref:Uncharacterized protein n=2 Tax=Folsomia candida TaxID=158441 RepID=A0A226DV36_FOLCA|nr:hypothetical protein Fcan01_15870 [Folsomia candida]